jgi:hypothetical protein
VPKATSKESLTASYFPGYACTRPLPEVIMYMGEMVALVVPGPPTESAENFTDPKSARGYRAEVWPLVGASSTHSAESPGTE